MGPHRPLPCTPSTLHPASGSLAEGGSRSLPFRQAFLCRENILVIVDVYPKRFLIVGLLKTYNSASPQSSTSRTGLPSVFLTQPLIRNLYHIEKSIHRHSEHSEESYSKRTRTFEAPPLTKALGTPRKLNISRFSMRIKKDGRC